MISWCVCAEACVLSWVAMLLFAYDWRCVLLSGRRGCGVRLNSSGMRNLAWVLMLRRLGTRLSGFFAFSSLELFRCRSGILAAWRLGRLRSCSCEALAQAADALRCGAELLRLSEGMVDAEFWQCRAVCRRAEVPSPAGPWECALQYVSSKLGASVSGGSTA